MLASPSPLFSFSTFSFATISFPATTFRAASSCLSSLAAFSSGVSFFLRLFLRLPPRRTPLGLTLTTLLLPLTVI